MVKTAHFQCTGHRFRPWLGKFRMFLGVTKTNKQTRGGGGGKKERKLSPGYLWRILQQL